METPKVQVSLYAGQWWTLVDVVESAISDAKERLLAHSEDSAIIRGDIRELESIKSTIRDELDRLYEARKAQ